MTITVFDITTYAILGFGAAWIVKDIARYMIQKSAEKKRTARLKLLVLTELFPAMNEPASIWGKSSSLANRTEFTQREIELCVYELLKEHKEDAMKKFIHNLLQNGSFPLDQNEKLEEFSKLFSEKTKLKVVPIEEKP